MALPGTPLSGIPVIQYSDLASDLEKRKKKNKKQPSGTDLEGSQAIFWGNYNFPVVVSLLIVV